MSGNLTPFKAGNGAAVTHSAYARLRLAPRAAELSDELRQLVPCYSPSDEPALQVLAITLAQLETANMVLGAATREQVERVRGGQRETRSQRDELRRLHQDARGWINTARRLLGDLGLTPTSRGALARNVAGARRIELEEYLEATYSVEGDAA